VFTGVEGLNEMLAAMATQGDATILGTVLGGHRGDGADRGTADGALRRCPGGSSLGGWASGRRAAARIGPVPSQSGLPLNSAAA
jgi:hypothetical protein